MAITKIVEAMDLLEILEHPLSPSSQQILRIQKKLKCSQRTVYLALTRLKEKHDILARHYNYLSTSIEAGELFYEALEWCLERIPDAISLSFSTQQKLYKLRQKLTRIREEYAVESVLPLHVDSGGRLVQGEGKKGSS